MKSIDIQWNEVSRFSQLIAIVLFVGVFVLGFFLGKTYEYHAFINASTASTATSGETEKSPVHAVFMCKDGKSITAVFYKNKVDLSLSDTRTFSLPQTRSGSGARYANEDESIVFWNKGITAFITESETMTFTDCSTNPIPA